MRVQLKPIEEQVIVITGASSGIGRVTARMAAARGARVVLAARDEPSLRDAVEEIRRDGGEAVYVVADVADEAAVRAIARVATETFGGFDTWVNNAGSSIYGELHRVPVADARRLFDVNYWGVVYGSLVAVEHLLERGGALINVGSVLSDRAIPLQGHYSASKHAVKGFTDALRMELHKEGAPISVSLIKPSSIATMYPHHAKNYMDAEPTLPPPHYSPDVVARTILACARHPRREIAVGAGGRLMTRMSRAMPQFMDRYMEAFLFDQQQAGPRNGSNGHTNLYGPVPHSGRGRTDLGLPVFESSLFTRMLLHPYAFALATLGIGVAAASVWRALR